MFTELVSHFMSAARALETGAKDSGYTSNGLRKLDFTIGGKVFTAIEQNPSKHSVPAMLARQGHQIVQVKDDETGHLLGNVDLTDKRWNSYETVPEPIDIVEIEKALAAPAATAVPAGR